MAAKADDDRSTPSVDPRQSLTDNGEAGDRRSIGLGEAFAFIVPLAETKEFAGEIVLRILQDGATPIDDGPPRFTIGSIRGLPMFQAPSPFEGSFWRPDKASGERLEFNPANGTASWHGPRRFQGDTPRDFMVMEVKRYNGKLPPVDIRMLGIRLRYDVALAALPFYGLWPPMKLQTDTAVPQSPTTLPVKLQVDVDAPSTPVKLQVDVDPPPPVKLPVQIDAVMPSTPVKLHIDTSTRSAPAKKLPSRLEEMRRTGMLTKPGTEQKRAIAWALDEYPPDGNIPASLTPSEMAEKIQQWRMRKDKPKTRLVDESLRRFCRRFLKDYHQKP